MRFGPVPVIEVEQQQEEEEVVGEEEVADVALSVVHEAYRLLVETVQDLSPGAWQALLAVLAVVALYQAWVAARRLAKRVKTA